MTTYTSLQPHPSGVSDGKYPSLPLALVHELRELVRGDVFARTDTEFHPRTTLFNGNVVTPAKAVVIPADVHDVSKVLQFCTKHNLYPSIKAGGYGTAGWAINGDVVVDLSKLNGIDIEPPLPASAPGGREFTSLRDMDMTLGSGVDKGKTKAKGEHEMTTLNTGKRRRSEEPDDGSGTNLVLTKDLPRDERVAQFLRMSDDFPHPAVRRRLDVDVGPSTPKVEVEVGVDHLYSNGDGDEGSSPPDMSRQASSASAMGMGMGSRTVSNEGSISGSTSTSTCMSTSTSTSTSASTTLTTPSTAPTSPRPKSENSNSNSNLSEEEEEEKTLDVLTSASAGLSHPPSPPLRPSPTPTLTPAPPPPPSRTPSFSVRSEDPFGYMSAAPGVPAPVLGAGTRLRAGGPARGYEQPVFERGEGVVSVASGRSGVVGGAGAGAGTGTSGGSVRSGGDGGAGARARAVESYTAAPVHTHAYVSFGAGVKQKDIDLFTAAHPLPATSPNGNVSGVAYHVPLAAHPVGSSVMLLGGFGFLSRLHGLSIDALVEVEMVLADGRIVYVNEKEHPDLWWAVRGAGPAFGVVTRYKAKAYPVPVVFAGNLIYNFHAPTAASLIKHFRDCVKSAPRELYANVLLTAGPADKGSLVVVQLCFVGTREKGRGFLDAIASWEGERCLLNEVSEKSFLSQQDSVAQILRGKAGRQWYIRSALITSLPDEIIHKTVNEFADTPVGCTWLFELAGGAVGDADDTCFPKTVQREAGFTIAAFHQWELDDDDPLCVTTAEDWIEKTLAPVSTGGPYPAFLGRHERSPRIIGCFGTSWPRLVALKEKYDPAGLFRHTFWPLDGEGRVVEPCVREPASPVMRPREV